MPRAEESDGYFCCAVSRLDFCAIGIFARRIGKFFLGRDSRWGRKAFTHRSVNALILLFRYFRFCLLLFVHTRRLNFLRPYRRRCGERYGCFSVLWFAMVGQNLRVLCVHAPLGRLAAESRGHIAGAVKFALSAGGCFRK